MARPIVLVILALVLAGCGGSTDDQATSSSPPTTTTTTTTAAPTTTTDPLAQFTIKERAFIQAYTAAGIGSMPGGNADVARFGTLICQLIQSGEKPAETQATLTHGAITKEAAAKLYDLAHTTMCPEVALPDPNSFGPGTYEVGVDIQPGKYRSPGGEKCYWARLKKNQRDIIDNDLGEGGPSVFTVAPTDGYVELARCTWKKTG